MKIQEILGLPLKEGLSLINSNLEIKIVETFPENNKYKFTNNNPDDPYIIRIKEIDDCSFELLISYF